MIKPAEAMSRRPLLLKALLGLASRRAITHQQAACRGRLTPAPLSEIATLLHRLRDMIRRRRSEP
jgi:hypothetical protein